MAKENYTIKALSGSEAVVEAIRQINPEVIAVYPITPQTPIIEKIADFVADGKIDTELIRAESEHSALSAVVGAAACGVRSITTSSSQGLALMWEVLSIASGLRLPIVMCVANRALSGPINIHCDHSDSMGARDLGWVQIYSENNQEAYENMLLALRLAEQEDVLLPVMVMMDGFVISHGVENTKIYNDEIVKKFIGNFLPQRSLLNVQEPATFGPLELFDYYFETKRQQAEAMKIVFKKYLEVGKELSEITQNKYSYFEEYHTKDADVILVVMSSAAGTSKFAVDLLRKKNKKVGLIKPKLFRPFPYKEIALALSKAKVVAVLDRSESFGANPPLFSEIKNAVCDLKRKPALQSCVFGLGGRDLGPEEIVNLCEGILASKIEKGIKYLGLRD